MCGLSYFVYFSFNGDEEIGELYDIDDLVVDLKID